MTINFGYKIKITMLSKDIWNSIINKLKNKKEIYIERDVNKCNTIPKNWAGQCVTGYICKEHDCTEGECNCHTNVIILNFKFKGERKDDS